MLNTADIKKVTNQTVKFQFSMEFNTRVTSIFVIKMACFDAVSYTHLIFNYN